MRYCLRAPRWPIFLLIAAIVYVGSYSWLSRRGMREAPEYGLAGFLYLPAAEVMKSESLSLHHCLSFFFAPLNWADRLITGADGPVDCIMWRLSG